MNNLKSGPISANDLMAGLAKAKKLINKVDTGDFEKGFINENKLIDDGYTGIDSEDDIRTMPVERQSKFKAVDKTDTNKINNSRLPDNIKKAMMENPIPQITLNDTIDMDFVKSAKRLMEQDNPSPKMQQKSTSARQQTIISNNSELIPIIENIVRKTVTEILDKKLDQLLTAQKTMSINENLLIKVGDSVFKGKITGVKSAK